MKFGSKSISTISKNVEAKRDENEPADFETAITATQYGKFNMWLLLVSIPASFSSSFATTTMSYILPAAQCDLSLTLIDKGMLNACTYVGMITSAFLWGFLADILGRKKLQIWGYLLDAVCCIACAFSQSFWVLLIFKYLSGFIVTGPYTVLMSYLAEFHSNRYRARTLMLTGVFLSAGNVFLPLLAWWIIPQKISIDILNSTMHVGSWQIFLIICAIPSLIAGLGHMVLPESPKFLMSIGENEKALNVLQQVFVANTNQPKEMYPIKVLEQEMAKVHDTKDKLKEVEEMEIAKESRLHALFHGWAQFRPLLHKPYLMKVWLVTSIQFGAMMGVNTLRLWLPQLFTTIDEYNQAHNYSAEASLCDMLASSPAYSSNTTIEEMALEECTVTEVDDVVYINSIIVATLSVAGYMFVGTLINAMGKKNLIIVTFIISGLTGTANYWSRSSFSTLAFSSSFITLSGIASMVIITITVEMFPTSLRTMTVSLAMMSGRIGAMIGNMVFPLLLETGCFPPFLLIGGVTIACGFLCFLLPSKQTDFK